MDFKTYSTFSAIGGVLWVASLTLAGYYLGNVTFIKEHIDLVAVAIVLLSVIPIGIELMRRKRTS
jgi:membrane-associated protein